MHVHPLAAYLEDCRARHKTGATTPETSLYSPLETLLNFVGHRLKKPRVRCFMNLKNQGGDMPDGGLFTPDQIPKGEDEPIPGQKPSRGVIECKKPSDEIAKTVASAQVSRYWNRYNQVLVTNYREFVLIGRDDQGKPIRLESCVLADSEEAFWKLAAQAPAAVKVHEERLLDFLERCLRRPAPLSDPKDVAWFLASYARDARNRVEHAGAHQQMETVRKALEDALGLKVQDAKGEHFFQSTLVQTLFYGIFSAWVLWHRSSPAKGERFDWEKSPKYLHVPILRKLFRELTDPSDLERWDNLTEVMVWAADTLNRVERTAFFEKFQDAEAVQYFYEPFLEAFDPELRKQLGVWYTPPEIVKYMVARVDQVLRSDFNRPDGLADPSVYVLDPCCGTGAYLVETLSTIESTLREKGEDALIAGRLKQAATERIFGFEILPAPFVVAHLQLGLFLQKHGTALEERKHERAAVYLTNALTGWVPPKVPKKYLFPEMEEEGDAADKVKQKVPILVVIGNPPYNGYAGLPVEEEAGLVAPYRETKKAPKPQGQGLNDLYIRFFRLAERCITERHQQQGIVCYISNYSWLDGRSHTGLRERFFGEFNNVWIDNLHGNRIISEYAPDGRTSETVFAVQGSSPGIKIGTAIALMVRKEPRAETAHILYRDWQQAKAEERRNALFKSISETTRAKKYISLKPMPILGLAFRPMSANDSYTSWPLLEELFPISFPGVQTGRDDLLVDIDLPNLKQRMLKYFDRDFSHEEMASMSGRSMLRSQRFNPKEVREKLQKRGLLSENFFRFLYRPLEVRWIYWEPTTKLLDEKREEYVSHLFSDNIWLAGVQQNRKEYDPPCVTVAMTCRHVIERGANLFPLLLRSWHSSEKMFENEAASMRKLGNHFANLTDATLDYLNKFKGVQDTPQLFHHAIAILHAPAYAAENGAALRQDWPRIPLPTERKTLLASADLGRQVAALLDPETPVDAVTAGKIRPELKTIGAASKTTGGQFSGNDFAVTARWGNTGKGGITMPAKGKAVPRAFGAAEQSALGDHIKLLGPDTLDIYLNDTAFWKNIPRQVWEYTLGGYQVLKKWLSYREASILGRPLTVDEVSYFTQTARRIAALLLLGPALDENYRQIKANTYEWKR